MDERILTALMPTIGLASGLIAAYVSLQSRALLAEGSKPLAAGAPAQAGAGEAADEAPATTRLRRAGRGHGARWRLEALQVFEEAQLILLAVIGPFDHHGARTYWARR